MITTELAMKGRLIHHYRVESLLGEGGMGTVYRATDTQLERPVAIKMLHPHLVSQTSFMERFRNEALILARLNHPNIAVVYNFLKDGPDFFMAMEYVEGDSLELLIRRGGALPPAVAAEIVRQGLEGLAHAHRKNILHRDIKPANLMLTPEGTIKLMDFGIARVVGEQRLTQVNRVVGTLEYMAPELIQGEGPSPASDLYAMGILLHELLSGKLPFASRTDYELMQSIIRDRPVPLRKLNSQIPKELETIVLRALDKNPAKRFADAKEFQRALQPFFANAPALNPAQLMAPAPVADILNMQPARPSRINETKVVPPPRKPRFTKPATGRLADNWQVLLAGGLMLLALLFIGLIVFDRAGDTEPVPTVNSTTDNHSLTIEPQPQSSGDQAGSAGKSELKTPLQNPVVGETRPTERPPVTVGPTTPREATPRSPVTRPPVARKPGTTTPTSPGTYAETPPASTPIRTEPPVGQAVPPASAEPATPKVTARKTVSVRRVRVSLLLTEALSSAAAQEGQTIRFRVMEPVMSEGQVVILAGAVAYGQISRVKQAEDDVFRKKNLLEFRIQSVEAANGKRLSLRSATFSEEAKGQAVLFRPGQLFEVRTGDESLDF